MLEPCNAWASWGWIASSYWIPADTVISVDCCVSWTLSWTLSIVRSDTHLLDKWLLVTWPFCLLAIWRLAADFTSRCVCKSLETKSLQLFVWTRLLSNAVKAWSLQQLKSQWVNIIWVISQVSYLAWPTLASVRNPMSSVEQTTNATCSKSLA